ncbi:16463_t:CDS:2 [Cetraspora pellucida]|uniref:16463_t:CDS:1 n=1 Tax=Cetraspora pellucida TaxID=1433469 RepID=A0ACA9K4M7_9GLOM|nr:16463_t:CDS:2 [Cetraspora pellucida]
MDNLRNHGHAICITELCYGHEIFKSRINDIAPLAYLLYSPITPATTFILDEISETDKWKKFFNNFQQKKRQLQIDIE